jgi:hypothetical protein
MVREKELYTSYICAPLYCGGAQYQRPSLKSGCAPALDAKERVGVRTAKAAKATCVLVNKSQHRTGISPPERQGVGYARRNRGIAPRDTTGLSYFQNLRLFSLSYDGRCAAPSSRTFTHPGVWPAGGIALRENDQRVSCRRSRVFSLGNLLVVRRTDRSFRRVAQLRTFSRRYPLIPLTNFFEFASEDLARRDAQRR